MDIDNMLLRLLGRKRRQGQQECQQLGLAPGQDGSLIALATDESDERPAAKPPANYSVLPSLNFVLADQEEVSGGVFARSSAGLQLVRSRPPLTLTATLPDVLQVVARPAKEPGGRISSSTILSPTPSLTAMYTWPDRGHVSATLDVSTQKYTVGGMWKGELEGSIPTTVRVKWKEEDQSINFDSTFEVKPSHRIKVVTTPHSLHRLSYSYTYADTWSSHVTFNALTSSPSVALSRKLPSEGAMVTACYDKGSDEVSLMWRAAPWAKLQVSVPLGVGGRGAGSSSSSSNGPMVSFTLDPSGGVLGSGAAFGGW